MNATIIICPCFPECSQLLFQKFQVGRWEAYQVSEKCCKCMSLFLSFWLLKWNLGDFKELASGMIMEEGRRMFSTCRWEHAGNIKDLFQPSSLSQMSKERIPRWDKLTHRASRWHRVIEDFSRFSKPSELNQKNPCDLSFNSTTNCLHVVVVPHQNPPLLDTSLRFSVAA